LPRQTRPKRSISFTKGAFLTEPSPEEIKKNPDWAEARRIYDEWEMFEYSSVPVPANPEALGIAVKAKELSLSKETCEELGLEEESVYIAEGEVLDLTKAGPDDVIEAEVEANPIPFVITPHITTAPFIQTDPVIRTQPDMRGVKAEVVAEAIKKLKGRMY
jgi:hypothetical protein